MKYNEGFINDEEKKVINYVYLYRIKKLENIRADEIACTLDESKDSISDCNWDKFEHITSSLMGKGILCKNGDRYSIKDEEIYPLIDTGIINIGDIINILSVDTFHSKLDLKNIENKIENLKSEKFKLENELDEIKKKINEYEEIATNSAKTLEKHKIKIVEFMGIFISIFTLISVNVNFIKVFENIKSIYYMIALLVAVNVVTVGSLLIMLIYIDRNILNK
ncbi:hypothetical protein C3B64_07590 [Clostridium botulinum]|uniref:Uncharacterized protein n=1 Tax=Clostridium botulinum TaxID=1491 RepID=A0AAU8YVP8_CLOBO|nr:MFS transporter [Clostridium sporogenes]AVP64125.1 hypothetical protein C3B64_07590 [Clostridium botulinum]MCF4017026.1 hypothetical protein [Clostridium sporogenes]NFG01785.1 MFS transporter [Clostridium sporogenes]